MKPKSKMNKHQYSIYSLPKTSYQYCSPEWRENRRLCNAGKKLRLRHVYVYSKVNNF